MQLIKSSKFWNLLLPSVYFIGLLLLWIGEASLGDASLSYIIFLCIAGAFSLLVLVNIFLNNKLISKIVGGIVLFVSCYMMLALWDDFIDGEATKGYWVGVALFGFTITMAILYMIGYSKKPEAH